MKEAQLYGSTEHKERYDIFPCPPCLTEFRVDMLIALYWEYGFDYMGMWDCGHGLCTCRNEQEHLAKYEKNKSGVGLMRKLDEERRYFLQDGPKLPPRYWHQRVIMKQVWKFGSCSWFWRPTKEWKRQVDELFDALKAIPASDYMELSFLLEDEFQLDLSFQRSLYMWWIRRELEVFWSNDKIQRNTMELYQTTGFYPLEENDTTLQS